MNPLSPSRPRPDSLAHAFGTGSGQTETANELRRHRRARASWPARLLNKGGAIIPVTVCDVSEGGVGLLTPTGLPLGLMLDLAVSVPHPEDRSRCLPVTARVRVVFASFVGAQCRIGVQFVALPTPARLGIRQYVLSHS